MSSPTSAHSPISLKVDPVLGSKLTELARGRPIVIDYFASRRCGVTVGDLTASFGSVKSGAEFVELEPIGSVPVIAERRLLPLLAGGATLEFGGPIFARHPSIHIDRPERWIEFLDQHPASRR